MSLIIPDVCRADQLVSCFISHIRLRKPAMTETRLFSLAEASGFYLGFLWLMLLLLMDRGIFHRQSHALRMPERL
jgi:hypothetical protein